MISVRSCFQSDSHRFVSFNNTSVFCLVSSNGAAGFPATAAQWSFTRHCCWHRIFNFLRAFFMISSHSSSSGTMKKIRRNFLALSSFGFSIVHFDLSLRLDASDTCFHISGHNLSGLEVVCFLVSLPLDHVYPSCGFSLKKVNLVRTSPCIWQLTIPIDIPVIVNTFLRCIGISGNIDRFQWNRKWFFSRHV